MQLIYNNLSLICIDLNTINADLRLIYNVYIYIYADIKKI